MFIAVNTGIVHDHLMTYLVLGAHYEGILLTSNLARAYHSKKVFERAISALELEAFIFFEIWHSEL
jgi:hypothetical protein